MTDDKDFKQLVRDEAKRSGKRYSEVRAEMRPGEGGGEPATGESIRDAYSAVVEAIGTWIYGNDDLVRLVALALFVPGNVLIRAMPGSGMTILGRGVAAAIGGRVIAIDGRTGLAPRVDDWRADDVIVISHFDGLRPADQVAVVENRERPCIILAKVHPVPGGMPSPPDDDTCERFVFGADLAYGDAETELRIIDGVRRGQAGGTSAAVIDVATLARLREEAASVEIPDGVRRFAVDAIAATRHDDSLSIGASTVATVALVQATAAAAAAAGRDRATIEDAAGLLGPVLAHRVTFRGASSGELGGLVERARTAAAASASSR